MFGKGKYFLGGLVTGLVAGAVARELTPVLKEASMPIWRSLVKAGVIVYERGQEFFWDTYESIEDAIAEARLDVQEARERRLRTKQKQPESGPKIEAEEEQEEIPGKVDILATGSEP